MGSSRSRSRTTRRWPGALPGRSAGETEGKEQQAGDGDPGQGHPPLDTGEFGSHAGHGGLQSAFVTGSDREFTIAAAMASAAGESSPAASRRRTVAGRSNGWAMR